MAMHDSSSCGDQVYEPNVEEWLNELVMGVICLLQCLRWYRCRGRVVSVESAKGCEVGNNLEKQRQRLYKSDGPDCNGME